MLRTALLAAARSDRCRALVEDREVTLDHLGESTVDLERADATVDAYTQLLHLLGHTGLTSRAEVSLKRAPYLRSSARGRHDGHRGHGGPHHHRPDAGDGP